MGTLQRVLLLGCIPVGAWGVSRFMRPLVSPRARVVAIICYLGLPLPYGALGTGRWDGLVAYALFPFIALRLARAAGVVPFALEPGPHWRSRPIGQVAALGAVIALAAAFAPAVEPMVLVAGRGLGPRCPARRGAPSRAGASSWWPAPVSAVSLVLLAPWVLGTALAGKGAVQIFGLPLTGATAPDWGELLRFAIGPVARSPLAWCIVLAAALPLAVGRGLRLVWASRLWVLALGSWGLALATTRGDLGRFAPSESVVLAPAALAVAVCVGLGISAFENDLSGREFGWRQVLSVAALVLVGVGLLPVVGGAVDGRWGLPSQGAEQPLAFLASPSTAGVARVLWLGDPRALPVGGWTVRPGLAYALTPEDLPDATQVFTPAGPGPASLVGNAVELAVSGGTVHLGRLLASAGVRYVVVVDGLSASGQSTGPPTVSAPPPAGLERDLLEPGRPPGGARRARGAGLRQRRVRAGDRRAGPGAALDDDLVVPGCGGRGRLDAPVRVLERRRAGPGQGRPWHRVRGLRPGRQFQRARGRPHRRRASPPSVGPPSTRSRRAWRASSSRSSRSSRSPSCSRSWPGPSSWSRSSGVHGVSRNPQHGQP